MGPRLLLLLQLGAVAAASCLFLLAAGSRLDAAPRTPPFRGVPAGTSSVAPTAQATDVDDGVAAAAFVFPASTPPPAVARLSLPSSAPCSSSSASCGLFVAVLFKSAGL
ncbi:unnamed protein product [Urochloa humidicola]